MTEPYLTEQDCRALEILWMRMGHGHHPPGGDELSTQAWHKILQRTVEWARGQPMKGYEADTLNEFESLLRKTVYAPWLPEVFAEIRSTLNLASPTTGKAS